MATGGWNFQTGGQYKLGVHHQDVKFSFSSVIFPYPWGDTFVIQRIIFAQEAGFFVLFFNSFVCFNLKPPSWQYLCAVKRNICVFSFFHWTQRTGISPVGRDRDCYFCECRDSAFFEEEKSQNRSWWMAGLGRTVWISFCLLRTKDCNTIITDFSTLISILMKDEQDPKKNLIFPGSST